MPIPSFRPLAALTLLLSLNACAACPQREGVAAQAAPATITETFVSTESPTDELDSLATWRHPDGATWLIATAKSSHRLVVYDADTGQRLRDIGGKGGEPGRFNRPNGIAVFGDRLFVAERDNKRVQVLSLPDFQPIGSFGEGQMRSPYGLWLNAADDGAVDVYVTDNFMEGARYDVVPPLDQLDQRVRRYRLRFGSQGELAAESLGSFGDTGEANALRVVESIAGDPTHDRLLIADEFQPHSTLREYTLSGRATGRNVPDDIFSFEAEGVALLPCRHDRGYWIAVDQLSPLTVFHFFDRKSLARIGSFTGRTVAATDGIALRAEPTARFPSGALYAVHADKSVAAFDLREVVTTLKLGRGCL